MYTFDISVLVWPFLLIFTATLVVVFKATHSVIFTTVAAFVKGGIFLAYYSYFSDGTFTFIDDWEYLNGGCILLSNDVGITNLVNNYARLMTMAGGSHFLYHIYNAEAFRLFGVGYYAPVALNILLTLAIAWFGRNLAQREFNFSKAQRVYFFAFLLFHPDILAWSNIANGKDIFVLLLHILLLTAVSSYYQGRLVRAICLASLVSFILCFLRFYVVPLFGFVFLLVLLFDRDNKTWRLAFLAAGLAVLPFVLGLGKFNHSLELLRANYTNSLVGIVRFILTPIPFHTEEAYSFLDLPALLHWMMLPFACLGGVRLYRLRTRFVRFLLLYMLVFILLYSSFERLQGPRHRVQLDYALAVLQFSGLYVICCGRAAAKRRWRGLKAESLQI